MIRKLALGCMLAIIGGLTLDAASAADLVGKPAPAFELKGLDGKTYKLADLKGKIVVLEWANKDCPVWRRVMGPLKSTRDKYVVEMAKKSDPKRPAVVWLAVDSTHRMKPDDVRAFCKENKIVRPVLDDRAGAVGKSYRARTTPHMFIVDAKGIVAYDGAIDNQQKGDAHVNFVAQALDDLLADRTVSTPATKPYGCSVKYKR